MDRLTGKRLAAASAAFSGFVDSGFQEGELINNRYMVRHRFSTRNNDVYLCLEMGAWDYVALKLPRPRDDDKKGYKQWQAFYEEVENWARLPDHPHVVSCLYAGGHERSWFLALEWVGAPDPPEDPCEFLARVQGADPGAWLREFIRLTSEVCDGLAHIHAHGIIHGDLKPANVLIGKAGRAKITDLGTGSLAAVPASRAHRRSGAHMQAPPRTFPYIAPELWEHRPATVQTDIYALGCLLYEMAMGQTPFDAGRDDAAAWSRLHREQQPTRIAGLPDQVSTLIADCLSKNPAHRPATAMEVSARLADVPLPVSQDKAPADGEAEPAQDRDPFMPDMRARGRVSLMSAAGRTYEAIEQSSIAIRGHLTSGFTQLGKHLTGEPDSSLALVFNERGVLTAGTEDWIKATSDFMIAIRLDPRLAAAHANLGTNYQRLTWPTLAIIAFNRAIELDPEDQRLYLQRARLLSEHGWHAPAHEDYKRAVEIAPDDPDACYGMADSLAALGRHDEAYQYRTKGVEPGHRSDDVPRYLYPVRRRTRRAVLGETLKVHFKHQDGDYEAALAEYTAALAIAPWDTRILYERGETRLAAGDLSGAVEDLTIFLERASTTHPLAPDAMALLRQAQEAAGSPAQQGEEPDDEILPDLKSPGYIASKNQGRCEVTSFVNWLPLSPDQRLTLLDMLYAGGPGRQLKATRLLCLAYREVREDRHWRYEQMLHDLSDEMTSAIAGRFADAEIAGELAVRDGLGVPVLLTEVRLSPNPLRHVQFSSSVIPLLAWASSGAAGVWRVAPGVEEEYVILDEPRHAPQFAPDDSSYLMLAERELLVYREEGVLRLNVWDTEGGSILAACFCGNGTLAIGASSGWVAFMAGQAGSNEAPHVQLTQHGDHDLRLWPVTDDAIAAFSGGNLYEIMVPLDATGHSRVRQAESSSHPASARFMAASGPWVIWAVSPEELLLTRLDQPDMNVRLVASDATDRGLKSAAVSADGTVVAAVCGSFLHVWRSSAGEADYGYLPMTPQPFGECIAVSADGRYIATGTAAGSVAVYVTRIAEEP